jgi:CspA family cold shock protein
LKLTGTVKRYIAQRGFGFIKPDDSDTPTDEVFVHIRAVKSGNPLKQGDRVDYELGKDRDGRTRAENVQVIEA